MCFVKYHVSEDQSSIVSSHGGVKNLRNVSAYNELTWHFDSQFVDKQGHSTFKATTRIARDVVSGVYIS